MKYKTEQENFWAGEFGNEYIARNNGQELLASNLNFFSKALHGAAKPTSLIEFGANIGMNLKAIRLLYPGIETHGIEINETSAKFLASEIGQSCVYNQSILDFEPTRKFDVSLIKGVLIHINPEMLNLVYQKLFDAAEKYILVCEYYNPSPVTIAYRGHQEKLFKRDFAGELLDKFDSLTLADYGFVYRRDHSFPQDDITWFLLKKE